MISTGSKAWRLFQKSKLPVDTLLHIWDCIAPLNGSATPFDYNLEEFVLAMYFIHLMMDGVFKKVPERSEVPMDMLPAFRQSCVDGTSWPSDLVTPARAFSTDFREYMKTEEDQSVLPVLPPEVQNIAAKYFDSLANTAEGRISGDVAEPFLSVSQVTLEDLSRIWYVLTMSSETVFSYRIGTWLTMTIVAPWMRRALLLHYFWSTEGWRNRGFRTDCLLHFYPRALQWASERLGTSIQRYSRTDVCGPCL
jgi:hypothetical protein